MDKVAELCIQLVIIVLVSGVFVGFRASTFNIMSESIAKNLRYDYFDAVMNKDISFFDERRTGDLLSRLNSDIMVIQDSLSTNVSMVIRGAVFVVASLIIMMFIQWQLGLVTIASMIPIVLLQSCFNHKIRAL